MAEPLVAIDAMGGDHAPAAIVEGARQARAAGRRVVLVGDPGRILAAGVDPEGLDVVPADEVIGMEEDGARAVRTRKRASVVRAAELVRDGDADALVALGNTGAAMAASLLRIGRIRGVRRPAIAAVVPAPGTSRRSVLLDVGANADATTEMLVQFAAMGVALVRASHGVERPSVGLLNIGEEAGKGNALARSATDALASSLGGGPACFVGNVEGGDLITAATDVVVADGFTGNVALKAIEGTCSWIRGLALDDGAAGRGGVPWDELDPAVHNGALLVGLRGVAVIGHGASEARGVVAAVHRAADLARRGVVQEVAAGLRDT